MRKTRSQRVKPGSLRVWNIINPPNEPTYFPVRNTDHARRLIDALADSQLLQPEIESNVFGLEEYRDGEWTEWNDDEGMDIHEVS